MLYDILLRLRRHRTVLIGYIKEAFHQIEVAPEDGNVLRFLWLETIVDDQPAIRELRFKRIILGAGPSPFLLSTTLHHHLKKDDTDAKFVK